MKSPRDLETEFLYEFVGLITVQVTHFCEFHKVCYIGKIKKCMSDSKMGYVSPIGAKNNVDYAGNTFFDSEPIKIGTSTY